MSARIDYGEGEPWYPKSEVFNWREIWTGRLALNGKVERPPIFIYIDAEGYSQQLNEQNSMLFINMAANEMDAIAIIDERDGMTWWWFRGVHDYFEEMVQKIGSYSTVIHNDCPQDQVEANYLRVQKGIMDGSIHLDQAQTIPDEALPTLTQAEIDWFWKEVE